MTQSFVYRSPAIDPDPGWSEDLAPRLGKQQGIGQDAQLGSVFQSSIVFDDPDATLGHDDDRIIGLKQFDWIESAAPSGRRRIWTGYIGDRDYARGDGDRPSLTTAAANQTTVTLVDINAFLGFRMFTPVAIDETSSFNRPQETDVDRITALLAVDFLSTTLFDGLVATTDTVIMDANDYKNQRPIDVLNDCAQQSGKNFFVFYDEPGDYTPSAGDFGLFYDFNASAEYPANCSFSNVRTDQTGTCFGPTKDGLLHKDPSRICSGILLDYEGGTVYRDEDDVGLTTSLTYGWRDMHFSTSNIKTGPIANARADRYLRENSTEDETLTFSVEMEPANVNEWLAGQIGEVRFSHLPGFEEFTTVRCVRRTVRQIVETQRYDIDYEMTTSTVVVSGEAAGAFARQIPGVSFSGIPYLPTATTPGNVLLALAIAGGHGGSTPTDVRFKDNPATSGSPEVPPFPDHDGWTVLGGAIVEGAPAGGGVADLYVAAAWRVVAVGEVTITPVQVSSTSGSDNTVIYLHELPTSTPPELVEIIDMAGTNPDHWVFASAAGNLVGFFGFGQVDFGAGPDNVVPDSGVTQLQANDAFNNPAYSGSSWPPAIWLGQRMAGGVLGLTWGTSIGYPAIPGVGILIRLTAGIELPPILYPGNQS